MADRIGLLVTGDVPPGRIAEETRDLAATLARLGVTAAPPPNHASAGEKGILATLGALAIAQALPAIGDALLDGLKRYFTRDRSVVVELARPDGTKIRIEAKNVGSAAVRAFLGLARDTLG